MEYTLRKIRSIFKLLFSINTFAQTLSLTFDTFIQKKIFDSREAIFMNFRRKKSKHVSHEKMIFMCVSFFLPFLYFVFGGYLYFLFPK